MELAEITRRLRTNKADLAARYGVDQLWVFGSRARGDHSELSDLDLLVEFGTGERSLYDFAGLVIDLEDLLGVSVDLVDRQALRRELRDSVLQVAIPVPGGH